MQLVLGQRQHPGQHRVLDRLDPGGHRVHHRVRVRGSSSTRDRKISRSVSDSPTRPSRRSRASSSATNGFPPLRLQTWSASSGSTSSPAIAPTRASVSSRSSGARSSTRTERSRRSSASTRRSGWAPCSDSARTAASTDSWQLRPARPAGRAAVAGCCGRPTGGRRGPAAADAARRSGSALRKPVPAAHRRCPRRRSPRRRSAAVRVPPRRCGLAGTGSASNRRSACSTGCSGEASPMSRQVPVHHRSRVPHRVSGLASTAGSCPPRSHR